MIEPQHRDMVLRMFDRGLTIPAIHEAMAPALRLGEVQLIVAEKTNAERQKAAAARRELAQLQLAREERERKKALRARLKRQREEERIVSHFRVITIRPVRRASRKDA